MDVDIDPTTEEGKVNPFKPVEPGNDDNEGESFPMTSTSTHDTYHRPTEAETSFTDADERTLLIPREETRREKMRREEMKIETAWDRISKKYPKINPAEAKFTATLDDYGNVIVKLKRVGGKSYLLLDAGGREFKGKLPDSIKDGLGKSAEEIARSNEEEVAKRGERLRRLEAARNEVPENQRESIDTQIGETQSEIEQLERENEIIEERMSLKDRVKAIFKKYGFTAVAVVAAVGVVIGVIVTNLKAGLTSVAKGVGNGLKALGKKLGEMLPGMVGAIASFIFKTAGEVVGFLAKNAWLLIVAVVLYFVEQFKRRGRS